MTAEFPFQDTSLSFEERIEDLIGRLTIREKIDQLMHENQPIDRLGIPRYNWWNEACHGVGRNGKATVFPQVIGMAASWNRDLLNKVATAISDEARAKYHQAIKVDKRAQYQGITFWTPNVNIFRDPRWGRGQETYGEDPFLTAELATPFVKGIQGDHPKYLKASACAKHYAVHSGPEDERHSFDAIPSQKDLYETYLPAFKKLVDEGVETIMGAYNRVFGEPACGSEFLLVKLLRETWGFKGHVVSDCGAIDDFHYHHKVTQTSAQSAALAVNNGCDLNCGCTYNCLLNALKEGLISEEKINESLRRLLSTKFRLGLFDPEENVPWSTLTKEVIDGPEHRALARQAARESIVLLKNDNNVLPLKVNEESLLIVGPTAANIGALLGNYYGISSNMVTIMEGVLEKTDESTRVKYRLGCPLSQKEAPGVNYTFAAAEMSDVVIAVMGLDPSLEGEEGDTVASAVGGDRQIIELPDVQKKFLREMRKHARKLILLLTGGSAIAIADEHEYCDAVMQVWYPGCEGGRGVAEVIFGEASPSGKLPVSVPMKTEDLPPFNDYSMKGRTYRFAEIEPLYPFGFGLSYADFKYENLQLNKEKISGGESLAITVSINNTSDISASEVAQCYIIPPQEDENTPRATLAGFQKVQLAGKEKVNLNFTLDSAAFHQVDASGKSVLKLGNYGVFVGSASPGERSAALGAPAPVTASVQIV